MLNFKEISERVDIIRKQNGLTQEQFAARLNISQPAVSKYLKERVPPAEILLKIAGLGNTTIEWILTGTKSYLYGDMEMRVKEKGVEYDADWSLTQKIASLPADVREAILTLIDFYKGQGR